MKKFKVRI